MTLVFSGMMVIPIFYLFTPLFDFADYQLPIWAGIFGVVLWFPAVILFYFSYRDLGVNWSLTLEMRDEHSLARILHEGMEFPGNTARKLGQNREMT